MHRFAFLKKWNDNNVRESFVSGNNGVKLRKGTNTCELENATQSLMRAGLLQGLSKGITGAAESSYLSSDRTKERGCPLSRSILQL